MLISQKSSNYFLSKLTLFTFYWLYSGWPYAGTSTGSFCYCFANLIGNHIPMEKCSTPCLGFGLVTCGGLTGEFNIYSYVAGKSFSFSIRICSRLD